MKRWISSAGVLMALLVGAAPVSADPILLNGGFELGFTGWTRIDAVGSEGTFFLQTGTSSPVNGFTVPLPPEGINAAMTDAQGPGTHVLYQDFLVPTEFSDATLTFSLFVQNFAEDFFAPNTLEFGTPVLNQQARVDFLLPSANPFSVAPGDILLNVFRTIPGDPLVSGYNTYLINVTALFLAHSGSTLRLRFSEVDNVNFFNLGVDNVNLAVQQQAVIPEPGSLLLVGSGLGAAYAARRRNQRQRRSRQ